MNTEELDVLVNQTFSEINRLLVVKGGEYANAEDRLANFKRGAGLTGCTPLQVLFIYMSKHYDAVASFVQTSAKGEARPSSEPIEGRLDDLINYCLLAKGLIAEERLDSLHQLAGAGANISNRETMSASGPKVKHDPYRYDSQYTYRHWHFVPNVNDVEAVRVIDNADKPLNLGPEHC